MFCWFHDPRSRLFAAFRTSMYMLEIKPEIKNRIMTHERAIVSARYLPRQKQVNREIKSSLIRFEWKLSVWSR